MRNAGAGAVGGVLIGDGGTGRARDGGWSGCGGKGCIRDAAGGCGGVKGGGSGAMPGGPIAGAGDSGRRGTTVAEGAIGLVEEV